MAYVGWHEAHGGLKEFTEQHAVVPLVVANRKAARENLRTTGWLDGIKKAHLLDGLIAIEQVDGWTVRLVQDGDSGSKLQD